MNGQDGLGPAAHVGAEVREDHSDSAESPRSPFRRRLLKALVGGASLSIPTAALAYYVEPYRLVIERHRVEVPGWPRHLAGFRIGQLSDFHCDGEKAVARTVEAARLLLAERPDLVCLTGDFITTHPRRWSRQCAEALAPLTQVEYGALAVLGNHDHWSSWPEIVTGRLRDVGINVLDNHTVPLKRERAVWVVGLDDRCVGKQDPAAALRRVPEKAVKILLIHEPDYADEAPPVFALQLSGHSHGGQIKVPGCAPIHTPKFARRYTEGIYKTRNHLLYVNRGIGTVGPPMRFGSAPEVTILDIYPA